MIDHSLAHEVEMSAERIGRVHRLSSDETNSRVSRLAETYVKDARALWWWGDLKLPSKRIAYRDHGGLPMWPNMVGPETEAILVVTDDSEPPWIAYSGCARDLAEMLQECRFFEYFVAARDESWMIFDTHENELVVVGTLSDCL